VGCPPRARRTAPCVHKYFDLDVEQAVSPHATAELPRLARVGDDLDPLRRITYLGEHGLAVIGKIFDLDTDAGVLSLAHPVRGVGIWSTVEDIVAARPLEAVVPAAPREQDA
jgi:hypothetical protein